jgi:hypothetical protein
MPNRRARASKHRTVKVLCVESKVNPLTYLTDVFANARNKSITLPTPDEFTASNIAHVG